MPYKDKDKQLEANRAAQRRFKAKNRVLPEVAENRVLPEGITFDSDGNIHVEDEVFTRLMATADPKVCLPVKKPGDEGYAPLCEVTSEWQG